MPGRGGLAAVPSSARMELARSQMLLGRMIDNARSTVDNRRPETLGLAHIHEKARTKMQQRGALGWAGWSLRLLGPLSTLGRVGRWVCVRGGGVVFLPFQKRGNAQTPVTLYLGPRAVSSAIHTPPPPP